MCDHVDGVCDNTTVCNPGYKYMKYCSTGTLSAALQL